MRWNGMWLGACLAAACGGDATPGATGGGDSSTSEASEVTTTTTAPSTTSGTDPTTDPSTSASSMGSSSGAATSSTTDEVADSSSTGWLDVPGSAGCGLDPGQQSGEWVPYTMDVNGNERSYFVWTPPDYNPERPYAIVYQWHGCAQSPQRWLNNPPVEESSGRRAIHVRGMAIEDCWDMAPNGEAVALFDALVEEVEGRLCVDAQRRFATGYSSGAFISHRLACVRGDMLRGVATIGGGFQGSDCTGTTAAFIVHDDGDPVVEISHSLGARNGHVARNGCDEDGAAPVDPDPCVEYPGCDEGHDVLWCQTTGQGHARQDSFVGPAFWEFLDGLPRLD